MVPRALCLSLILNLALGGVVTWLHGLRDRPPGPDGPRLPLTQRVLRTRKVVVESPPQVLAVTAPFHWSDLESADYRVYMANLRAIGCPERTVRDLIVADVDALFLQRVRTLFYPLHGRVWWMLANEEQAKELAEGLEQDWEGLMDERKAVFQELLGREQPYAGDEAEEAEGQERARWAHTLDFLSPEKQDSVLALRKTTEAAIRELWATDHPLTKAEHQQRQQRQRELEADRDQRLAEQLTPGELAEYQLRTSEGADLRHRLSQIEFSEDEMRAIVGASRERHQRELHLFGNDEETRQGKMAIAQAVEAGLKETLGESRYADYQRANDARFEQISQVVERHGLSPETAQSAYDLQREAAGRAEQVRLDSALSAEERQALRQAIRDETERALKAALGEKAFVTLERRGAATWLDALTKPGG